VGDFGLQRPPHQTLSLIFQKTRKDGGNFPCQRFHSSGYFSDQASCQIDRTVSQNDEEKRKPKALQFNRGGQIGTVFYVNSQRALQPTSRFFQTKKDFLDTQTGFLSITQIV
jgi:hypothetical protein